MMMMLILVVNEYVGYKKTVYKTKQGALLLFVNENPPVNCNQTSLSTHPDLIN